MVVRDRTGEEEETTAMAVGDRTGEEEETTAMAVGDRTEEKEETTAMVVGDRTVEEEVRLLAAKLEKENKDLTAIQVFSVSVNLPIPKWIYGTVTIHNVNGDSQDIFSREKQDCQYMRPGGADLLLTDPKNCESAVAALGDLFSVVVALMDKDIEDPSVYNYPKKHECSEKCKQIDFFSIFCSSDACGSYRFFETGAADTTSGLTVLEWRPFDYMEKFDESLTINNDIGYKKLGIDRWSVTVKFAPISVAVKAFVVGVVLKYNDLDLDLDCSYAHVCGEITATISGFTEKIVLFHRGDSEDDFSVADNGVDVTLGDPIPLSRSLIYLPYESSLTVWADLQDGKREGVKMAGSAEFPVRFGQPFQKEIEIAGGEIQVRVLFTGLRP